MPRKGDFTQRTKNELQKRAGNKCSRCKNITTGPTLDPEKSINIGEAAHIYGVGENSARYDLSKKEEDLKSIENGLWLCNKCHTLVDRDVQNFTVEKMLKIRTN
jgi:ribosomal protein L37AE/L43A